MTRFDETWHQLLDWTQGQAPSERLAALPNEETASFGELRCTAAHLVFDGRPAGRPRVEAASRCLTRKRMWFITARETTSGLTKYQQLAGQRLVLEQLPYPGALTLGQFPGPRVTMPIGECVGNRLLAFLPSSRDRGQVGGAVPLLDFEGSLPHQVDQPPGRRKVVVRKLTRRYGTVSDEGE